MTEMYFRSHLVIGGQIEKATADRKAYLSAVRDTYLASIAGGASGRDLIVLAEGLKNVQTELEQGNGEAPSLTFAQRVSIIRKIRKMSARVLAEKTGTGVTRAVIANLECGKKDYVRSDQIVPLCDALGISTDVLLRGTDDAALRRYFVEAVES